MKKILIDYCKNCPYRQYDYYTNQPYCSEIENFRDIIDIGIIPKWCPLEDEKESEK